MNLFQLSRNTRVVFLRYLKSQNTKSAPSGSTFICSEEKSGPNFDGIQFALLNNESLAISYVKEAAVTATTQFSFNNLTTDKIQLPMTYSNDSIKLLVLHGLPLTPQLHRWLFNVDIDCDYCRWVRLHFKNRSAHDAEFYENIKSLEHRMFPLKSKFTNEPITFGEEDRHFGFIHSGGYTTKQMEYSLYQLGLRVRRLERPGEEKWVCTQLVNNVYSSRKFHFTIKDKVDYPPDKIKHMKHFSVHIKGKNEV